MPKILHCFIFLFFILSILHIALPVSYGNLKYVKKFKNSSFDGIIKTDKFDDNHCPSETLKASENLQYDATTNTYTYCDVASVDHHPKATLTIGEDWPAEAIIHWYKLSEDNEWDELVDDDFFPAPNRRTITLDVAGTYKWTARAVSSDNIVINGDFSDGNNDFTSAYTYVSAKRTGPTNTLGPEGHYAVGTNPNDYHSDFSECNDHTRDSQKKMMILNGASTPGVEVWRQTIDVQPNTTYDFSAWFTSVHSSAPGQLVFSINNDQLTEEGGINLSSTTCQWDPFFATWESGLATTASIAIVNLQTAASGNDFAIDDINFSPVCVGEQTFNLKIRTYATTADIVVHDACNAGTAELIPSASDLNHPIFTWYRKRTDGGYEPIINGMSDNNGAVTLHIDNNGKLSVTGDNGTYPYYVSVKSDERCENAEVDFVEAVAVIHPTPMAPNITIQPSL